MRRCLGFDCQPTIEVSRCRSFSNATLFRKIIAVAVELSRDFMLLALVGVQPEGGGGGRGGVGGLHIMDYTRRLRQKGIPFLRVQVYERAGISQVEAYERVRKSVIADCERTYKG